MGMKIVHSCGNFSLFHQILHQDLKTPNVFLKFNLTKKKIDNPFAEESIAKVADFGLSRLIQGKSFKVIKGSDSTMDHINPTWSAPEILDGKEYTTKSDVYPMGIMLWELFTRKHPFCGSFECEIDLAGQIQSFISNGGRPTIPSDCPQDYKSLMEQCWAQNPDDRPEYSEIVETLKSLCLKYVSKDLQFPEENNSFSSFSHQYPQQNQCPSNDFFPSNLDPNVEIPKNSIGLIFLNQIQPSFNVLKHIGKSICAFCNSVCKKSNFPFLKKHKTCI